MPKNIDKDLPKNTAVLKRAVKALGDSEPPEWEKTFKAIEIVLDLFMNVCPTLQDHEEFGDTITFMFATILPQGIEMEHTPENEELLMQHLERFLGDDTKRSKFAADLRRLLEIALEIGRG